MLLDVVALGTTLHLTVQLLVLEQLFGEDLLFPVFLLFGTASLSLEISSNVIMLLLNQLE